MGREAQLDSGRLMKLRIAVARHGEMDVARWWNTDKQLSATGAMALRRGFPRTHHFAQARSVIAVASHRCAELFNPAGCVTLWNLPDSIEEELDTRWEGWLDDAAGWKPFFNVIANHKDQDLVSLLRKLELVTDAEMQAAASLRTAAEGKAVPLPGVFHGTNEDIALLALGFAKGVIGSPAIPYARRGGA